MEIKNPKHKAGFINIIGKPNVGKSTLMNELVGERLSIITSKAQTTRHRILGIVNEEDYQIIFSDTPGIIDPHYKLQESMMDFVDISLKDADVLLVMVEVRDKVSPDFLEKLTKVDTPKIFILNKIDGIRKEEAAEKLEWWKKQFEAERYIAVSALHKHNVKELFETIVELLPFHPPYYSKDELTDKPYKFFVSEIIREKILLNYHQEIPYSVEIEVESFKEEPKITRIRAVIYADRQSQKPILIGRNGSMLKKVGTEARKDIETFLEKKVFLELFVKVKEGWRNSDTMLKNFGYKQ